MAKTTELDIRKNYSQNYIINGNFDFWQRGTSFSIASGGSYTADRWKQGRDGSGDVGTLNRQAFALGQTAVPNEPTYYLQYNQTTAGTGTTVRALEHRIESVRTLAGKSCTVSFYAQADSTRTVGVYFQQSFGTGGSPSGLVNVTQQNITVTSSWQKFTLTFVIPSISGKTLGTNNNDFLDLVFNLPLNAVMTINLAQVMLNEGTEAAPFSLAGRTIQGETVACQRFYEVVVGSSNFATGLSTSTTAANAYWQYQTPKRALPTIIATGGTFRYNNAANNFNATGVTNFGTTIYSTGLNLTGMTGIASGNLPGIFDINGSGTLAADAEL